jgi:methionyl-tRNA synthetase
MVSSMVLSVLLMNGGIEYYPGLVEVENTVRLLCTGCGGSLKSRIQCEPCGHWYHYSCGSVKAQMSKRESWNCDKCRTVKVRMLQTDLQNALRHFVELKARNSWPEATGSTWEEGYSVCKANVYKVCVGQ